MNPFIKYLENVKQLTTADVCNTPLHVVMGNESCDLDSMISTLALAYFHHQKSETGVVIPILNVTEDEFCLRTENNYLLRKVGLEPNMLIFRNHLNLQEIQSRGSFSLSLVDHHMLRPEDQILATSVIEIFDHRPMDPNAVWDKTKTKVRIEEVGSCSTLITDEILKVDIEVLNQLLANLIYYVIIFDTIALNPEAGRVKELDVVVAKKLAKQFSFSEDFKTLFDELWNAHNDVTHLSPKQLLSKDLKIVEGIPVPGLPMLNEEYLKLPNAVEDMKSFCLQKDSITMIIIGLEILHNEVCRDIAVFSSTKDTSLGESIIMNLKNALALKGYDFCLEEVGVEVPNVKCFKQKNAKLTRKHILPIVKDTIIQYRQTNKNS